MNGWVFSSLSWEKWQQDVMWLKKGKTRQAQKTSSKDIPNYQRWKKLKFLRRERSSDGMTKENMDGLTASVALLLLLLQARCSQLSLWFFSSGVQEARKALWMTRLGVFVKEKARVTLTANVVRWVCKELLWQVFKSPFVIQEVEIIKTHIRTRNYSCTTDLKHKPPTSSQIQKRVTPPLHCYYKCVRFYGQGIKI